MSKLWVKFEGNNATRVSTEGCEIVDDFIEAVKKKLLTLYGEFPNGEISISLTEGGQALQPDLQLNEISALPGYTENNYKHPLFITVASSGIEV